MNVLLARASWQQLTPAIVNRILVKNTVKSSSLPVKLRLTADLAIDSS
jgi:hypothetical protein